jgi:hypothetical protein
MEQKCYNEMKAYDYTISSYHSNEILTANMTVHVSYVVGHERANSVLFQCIMPNLLVLTIL